MATILEETFNNVAGYDLTWAETISGGTCNENAAEPAGPPTGFGSECLNIVSAAWANTYTTHTHADSHAIWFFRSHFIVDSETLANSDANDFLWFMTSTDIVICVIRIRQTAAGQLELYIRVGDYAAEDTVNIAIDTSYCLEIFCNDTANTWEWKLNNVSQGSGSANPGGSFNKLRIGATSDWGTGYNLLVDNVKFDDTTWVGAWSAAGGSILPLVAFGTLGGNCNPMMG